MTFTNELFLNIKDILEFLKISELSIQRNKDSGCEHIAGGVNIYPYWCVSPMAPQCAICLYFYFVCKIKLM